MDKLTKIVTADVQNLIQQGRTAEAVFALEDVASWSLAQLAVVYGDNYANPAKAEEYLRTACRISPGNWAFHANLAHILNQSCRWQEAKEEALQAIAYSEGNAYEPLYNLGVILVNLNDHEGAIEVYRKAMALKKDSLAHYNISASLLALGFWDEGWAAYENRFKAFDKIKAIHDRFKRHYHKGDKLRGRAIYVYSEQGVGDLIQCSRYLYKLRELGARVILESQESAANLFKENFNFEVVSRPDGSTDWPKVPEDVYCAVSVCSLPGIFDAGKRPIPRPPYLQSTPREPIRCDKFKVGICWAGSPDHQNDYRRSIFLRQFAPLFNVEGVQLFSLQKDMIPVRKWFGKNVDLMAGLPPCGIIDLSRYLKDYADTAAYINQMDLVISVDTSIAHLAGALGKPTWLLVDRNADWRWGIQGDRTEWYPSFRIFRQERAFEWQPVFNEVKTALEELVR